MTETASLSGRTAWTRNVESPLRAFLRTETGSAALLLAATVAALVWANVDQGSYASVWGTRATVRVGSGEVSQTLGAWVNSGLMAFFFFVVGLEARREFDLGELRERRRLLLPAIVAASAMAAPVAIYLLANAGRHSAHGWGVAMSTDTAFALGLLAAVGRRFPGRLRAFVLTVSVADDLIALIVIATVYASDVVPAALLAGVAILAAVLVVRAARVRSGIAYFTLGVAAWVAFVKSGVDPVVVGLAMGLLAYARPPAREDLERATDLFRSFREQPTSELARSARAGLESALSPNERLQQLWHPWTSYAIVPLFALVNAGIPIDGGFLGRAYGAPITLGIAVGYVVGKPVAVVASSWLTARLSRGRVRPPVGWAAVAGGGAISAVGFTVALLIATLAFHGLELQEAKLGILTAAVAAAVLTWLVARVTAMLPQRLRARALLGGAQSLVDLAEPVDPERDHFRGPVDAPVTLVEYGDFECPYCGQAEAAIRELLRDHGDVRYVWRHLPLRDVHARAQLAAEAAEAAARQERFWEMHDLLLDNQEALSPRDLAGYAERLGLDVERFREDLRRHAGAARIADDVDSADLSAVSGTPTFFVNGRRHYGAYDLDNLVRAVKAARTRVAIREAA